MILCGNKRDAVEGGIRLEQVSQTEGEGQFVEYSVICEKISGAEEAC